MMRASERAGVHKFTCEHTHARAFVVTYLAVFFSFGWCALLRLFQEQVKPKHNNYYNNDRNSKNTGTCSADMRCKFPIDRKAAHVENVYSSSATHQEQQQQ